MEITLHGWRAIGTCRRASSKEKKEKKRDNSTNLTNLWTFLWKQTTKALNPPPPKKKAAHQSVSGTWMPSHPHLLL